jgi:hypothetical protein
MRGIIQLEESQTIHYKLNTLNNLRIYSCRLGNYFYKQGNYEDCMKVNIKSNLFQTIYFRISFRMVYL